ncbi:Clavaminate synthase-like protein [Backusella circina FSU 941]|nr:Clavaminate synthase-like protein [Backusella circina FSU 941]
MRATSLHDYCNDRILLFPFKDVPTSWRRLMMDGGMLKCACQLKRLLLKEHDPDMERHVQTIMADLDTCHVICGAPGRDRRQVTLDTLDELQSWLSAYRRRQYQKEDPEQQQHLNKKIKTQHRNTTDDGMITKLTCPIKRRDEAPSLFEFLHHCNQCMPTPFIIPQGVIDDWPAFHQHPWSSIDYLLSVASERMVPIELGSQYTDAGWGQKMMRFADFIQDYIIESPDRKAYLAQHDLFHQIPRLEGDMRVPDYCYMQPNLTKYYTERPEDVIKNAWFGPAGTVSPLHQDPYHNLLAQVVGCKYIRLYSPDQTALMYPHEGLMTNTSQVDLEKPDHTRFPQFKDASYVECILNPGELLYIPPKWWHYVKSLETSFSVSLWF